MASATHTRRRSETAHVHRTGTAALVEAAIASAREAGACTSQESFARLLDVSSGSLVRGWLAGRGIDGPIVRTLRAGLHDPRVWRALRAVADAEAEARTR